MCKKHYQQSEKKPYKKISANHISDMRLVSRIYEELFQFNNNKRNNPIQKWAKDLNRNFSKEDTQMVNMHWKRCQTSPQIKYIVRYYFTSIKIPITKKEKTKTPQNNKCYQEVGN